MVGNLILAALAVLSCVLALWQHIAARRFPLHQKIPSAKNLPPVTLLKPLKGTEPDTEMCLRSWFTQEYPALRQILFGVADLADPVCPIVQKLQKEFPQIDAQLVHCHERLGTNAKVSSLIQLHRQAKHELIVVSDADVFVANDFLTQTIPFLADDQVGLVNCFYQLSTASTPAMHWEAVAINADFWSQVLQSRTLQPINFALGAVMLTRQKQLSEIGGFENLADYLADDYRLGNLIAQKGYRIELANQTVECRSGPMTWGEVWAHQLRWSRTIRVCQPAPYFFSILSNASLWPLLWLATFPALNTFLITALFLLIRLYTAAANQRRLTGQCSHVPWLWLVPVKDILQTIIWALSFIGNHVIWRGVRYRVQPGGKLVPDP